MFFMNLTDVERESTSIIRDNMPITAELKKAQIWITLQKHFSNLFGYLPRTSYSSQIARCHQHRPVEVTSKLIFSCLLCFSQLKKLECRTVLFSWKAETWELLCDLHLSIWILPTEHTQRTWFSSWQCKETVSEHTEEVKSAQILLIMVKNSSNTVQKTLFFQFYFVPVTK